MQLRPQSSPACKLRRRSCLHGLPHNEPAGEMLTITCWLAVPRIHENLRSLGIVLSSFCHLDCRLIKKSNSDEDVFSAVGGMELGRHDATSSTAASVQPMPQAGSAGPTAGAEGATAPCSPAHAKPQPPHAAAGGQNPFSSPAIGDLPFSDTPSRTLIVQNVAASRSDQDLQHLFEVSIRLQHLSMFNVAIMLLLTLPRLVL